MTQQAPEQNSILDDAWDQVVGGMDWLKSVFLGEFADHRPLSAVVADMLVSFIPGVVIVTSARDAVAVILRLATHPEKREELMEWVLLSACLIVIALPLAMAAGGLAAAGVGAIVGGIAGSELGAALRAVMLMLIKEASKLVELVQFLQKFIKGDILKFLRAVNFAKYEKPLIQALNKIAGKLVEIVKSLRAYLESLRYFDAVKATILKLTEWEKKFYAVQQDALKQVPKALAELDARLAKVLAQTAPKEAHTVAGGVQADKTAAAAPAKQRVKDTPGNVLAKVDDKAGAMAPAPAPKPAPVAKPAPTTTPSPAAAPKPAPSASPAPVPAPKTAPTPKPAPASTVPATPAPKPAPATTPTGAPPPPPPKASPDPVKPPDPGANTKALTAADAAVAVERERITQLSKEALEAEKRGDKVLAAAKIEEARAILRPHLPKNSSDSWDEVIKRLDVASPKDGAVFWSGDPKAAQKFAEGINGVTLETTSGGRIIDGWDEVNKGYAWDKTSGTAPYARDLWKGASEKYAEGASGIVNTVQTPFKLSDPRTLWHNVEKAVVKDSLSTGKIEEINMYSIGTAGDFIPLSDSEIDVLLNIKGTAP